MLLVFVPVFIMIVVAFALASKFRELIKQYKLRKAIIADAKANERANKLLAAFEEKAFDFALLYEDRHDEKVLASYTKKAIKGSIEIVNAEEALAMYSLCKQYNRKLREIGFWLNLYFELTE